MRLNVIQKIISHFTPPTSRERVVEEVKLRNDMAAREMAARYTRGNVAIQRGDMIFSEDLGPRGAPNPQLKNF